MAEQDDVYIGRRLLEQARIRREDLIEILFQMALDRRQGRAIQPLGLRLVARGVITRKDLHRLLSEQVRRPGGELTSSQSTDLELGDLLVASGVATAGQVNECLRLQRQEKVPGEPSRRIGELLVERGYATWANIARALQYLGKTMYRCPRCGARFNVLGAKADKAYACKECGGTLEPAAEGGLGVKGTIPDDSGKEETTVTVVVSAQRMPEVPPDAQAHIDRAIRLYLRQRGLVKRSVLQEAERFQMELSSYGLWASFPEIVQRLGGLSWQQLGQLQEKDFQAIVESEGWKKQTVPGYRVVRRISSGGFATVFEAEQVFGGRRVALKVLHADRVREPASLALFKREAGLLIKFAHPNVVKGLEYGEEGPVRFIVMELVAGDTVDRVVRESGGLSVLRALSVTLQIAEALRYMQREGYIHRDVKPGNILVDRQGRARLCDLGFAVPIRGDAVGASETTLGTPLYVSPEQARGELDLKAGTDIYALGLTLYFMLSAEDAFGGVSSDRALEERFGEGVLAPDLQRLKVPTPVLAVLKKMIDPRREVRFGGYPELIAALDAAARWVVAGK